MDLILLLANAIGGLSGGLAKAARESEIRLTLLVGYNQRSHGIRGVSVSFIDTCKRLIFIGRFFFVTILRQLIV